MIMKIKLTSINSKLVAGLTAFTLMTSMTGCTQHERFIYTKDEEGVYTSTNTIENRYLKNYYIIITKIYDKYYINLGRKGSEKNETYYDAFSNNGVIYQSGAEGFTNVEYETMPLTEFILYYDGIIKEEYTSEELVDLYAKIISDFEIDVSNKKLVLNK